MLDSINLAADLGAEVVWLKSTEVVQAILDFANDKRITRIMVGRTRPELLSRSVRSFHDAAVDRPGSRL